MKRLAICLLICLLLVGCQEHAIRDLGQVPCSTEVKIEPSTPAPADAVWRIVRRPAGSTTKIDLGIGRAYLVADVVGTYEVALVQPLGAAAGELERFRVTAVYLPPTCPWPASLQGATHTDLPLPTAMLSDLDGHPFTLSWDLVETPPGATASLRGPPEAPVFRTIDVGTYRLALRGSDALGATHELFMELLVTPGYREIGRASGPWAYSRALDRLALSLEDRLAVFEPSTDTLDILPGAAAATIGLSADELQPTTGSGTDRAIHDLEPLVAVAHSPIRGELAVIPRTSSGEGEDHIELYDDATLELLATIDLPVPRQVDEPPTPSGEALFYRSTDDALVVVADLDDVGHGVTVLPLP